MIFITIIIFLVRWQLLDRNKFTSQASQRILDQELRSLRGEIFAADGTSLAYSDVRYNVYAYLPDIEIAETPTDTRSALQSRQEFITKVSNILNISESEITSILYSGPNWVKLAEKIDVNTKEKLEKIYTNKTKERVNEIKDLLIYKSKEDLIQELDKVSNLSWDEIENLTKDMSTSEIIEKILDYKVNKIYLTGLNFEFTSERIFPENELACHVVGFLGKDLNGNDIGRGGIEQKYDGLLEPQEGYIYGETDQYGNLITLSDSYSIRAKRGSSLVLTIDTNIQKILERKLKEGIEQYEADEGSAIIMDPKTGAIIAMANYPTFDPNKYWEIEDVSVLTNKIVNEPYEIGSIAKPFTMAAAVEELNIEGGDVIIDGHDGCIEIQASDENDIRTICTASKRGMGPLTAVDALAQSDNLAFAHLGDQLGKEQLYQYLSGFGVGKPTSIDLGGESIGYLPDLDDPYAWHPVDIAVFSYGHGYQMNLIQAIRGLSVVINNGWLMQPYVVSEIHEPDGTITKFDPLPIEKVITEETSRKVTQMMHEVFIQHTSTDFRDLKKYNLGSKSGTALIPYKDKPGYSDEVNATYVGFDASEDRKFIMAIRLNSPKAVKKLSFYSARPLWFETFLELKDLLGITPDE